MKETKKYISGHNIRRFFSVTEEDLKNVRKNHADKIINNDFTNGMRLGS